MRLATGCPPLDDLLGGGVEAGAITLVYGEAGTGKTNLCLQLAAWASIDGRGKTAYVDTEGVSVERLSQIADVHAERVLRDLLFFSPQNLEEQEHMIRSLEKIAEPALIVVDSINLYYRLGLADGAEAASKSLTTMMGDLLRLSRASGVPIVVTAQVYTGDDGARAFGGRIMEHIVKTSVRLDRLAPGARRATLLKHRSLAEGRQADFFLTQRGLAASPSF